MGCGKEGEHKREDTKGRVQPKKKEDNFLGVREYGAGKK
jgi:hypothetical protein